jgi:hypothetical protein
MHTVYFTSVSGTRGACLIDARSGIVYPFLYSSDGRHGALYRPPRQLRFVLLGASLLAGAVLGHAVALNHGVVLPHRRPVPLGHRPHNPAVEERRILGIASPRVHLRRKKYYVPR